MDGIDSVDANVDTGAERSKTQGANGTDLKVCCTATIDQHADNNPMMVCSDCKQIIKCFDQERAFRNYKRFCASRHRRILATQHLKWWVIVFKSYDTFTA